MWVSSDELKITKQNNTRLKNIIMKIEVYFSDCDYEPFGTIALSRGANLSIGKESIGDPIEWLEEKLGRRPLYEYTNKRLKDLEADFYREFVALPIYKYEHSGISISTSPFSCRWDSGKIGYIYMTTEKAREFFNVKRLSAKKKEYLEEILKGEIDIFNSYINNEYIEVLVVDSGGDGEVVFGSEYNMTNGFSDTADDIHNEGFYTETEKNALIELIQAKVDNLIYNG